MFNLGMRCLGRKGKVAAVKYSCENMRIQKNPAEMVPAFVHLVTEDLAGLHVKHVCVHEIVGAST